MDPTSLIEHPTLAWEAVNDGAVFYSRRHVYHMNWNLGAGGGGSDLNGYVVAAARFGGPIGQSNSFVDYFYRLSTSHHPRQLETHRPRTHNVYETSHPRLFFCGYTTREHQCTFNISDPPRLNHLRLHSGNSAKLSPSAGHCPKSLSCSTKMVNTAYTTSSAPLTTPTHSAQRRQRLASSMPAYSKQASSS